MKYNKAEFSEVHSRMMVTRDGGKAGGKELGEIVDQMMQYSK
jgi:hypothetical protein